MSDSLDLWMRWLAYPVCWSILVNGIDDMFIDFNFFTRGLKSEHKRFTVRDLRPYDNDDDDEQEQQRIAMLVPAWQEEGVIRQMLELNLEQLAYSRSRYDIFVGVYQNDQATQDQVDLVARNHRNVHKAIVLEDGPTNKANCLNWVYQNIQRVEEERGERFDILLMHDAEDIIHPLALRLYNKLIPEYDFVQTPVFPMPLPWNYWVGSTYKDEFTEHHLKDMLVRKEIGGIVPSAGVGSGFDRDAFEEIALAGAADGQGEKVFDEGSLTEDYIVGTEFRLTGKKVYFACHAIERVKEEERRTLFGKKRVLVAYDEYIATREYFPVGFWPAVKQRSRWVLGIVFQAWEQIGWKGSPPVRYTLWRDRKALITNLMAILGYVLASYCILRFVIGQVTGRLWTYDNIFAPGSVLWWLVMSNFLILAWRAVMKFYCVDLIYGPVHGALSLPRFFVSNVINFLATTKAAQQWLKHKITGEPLRWAKTEHVFPSLDALREYQKQLNERLGDILRVRNYVSERDLNEALDLQGRVGGLRLGEVMSLGGYATAGDVADALAEQAHLERVVPDASTVPLVLLRRIAEADAKQMGILPLSLEPDERVRVAVANPPSADLTERLESILRQRVEFVFTDEPSLERARDRAYRRLVREELGGVEREPLGERLVARGLLRRAQLDEALREQIDTDERLGELVVRRGWVPAAVVGEALATPTSMDFRPVSPDQVDPNALQKLGYGLCALYALVPLRRNPQTGRIPVAAASPLHEEVRFLVAAKVGGELDLFLAPSLDVRLALAIASRVAWSPGISAGVGGMDGVELDTIRHDPGWRGDLEELRDTASAAGAAPIEYLLNTGRIAPQMAARLRARALGVALARPSQLDPDADHNWLPPGWALQNDIQLLDLSKDSLVLAAPRPTPRLAREVAALFPDVGIAWRVAPYSRAADAANEEETDITSGRSESAPVRGGP